jgi:hypothetical protein
VADGFTFFLAAFANKELKKDSYTLTIIMTVLIGEAKTEKEAKCTLRKDATAQTQASFDCKVEISESEKNQINFNDPEAIKLSTDNPNIGGISINEMLSPLETDKAIEEVIALLANGTLTDLAYCIDYSLEGNADIKPPATLEITSLISYKVDGKVEKCRNGQLLFKGIFSEEITEEMIFDLFLSFPALSLKCKVDKAKKKMK